MESKLQANLVPPFASASESWIAVFSEETFDQFKQFCCKENKLYLGGSTSKLKNKTFSSDALIFFYITGRKHFIGFCNIAATQFQSNTSVKIYKDAKYNEMIIPIEEVRIASEPMLKLDEIFNEDPQCFKAQGSKIGGSAFGLVIKQDPFANVSDCPKFCDILKRKTSSYILGGKNFDFSSKSSSSQIEPLKNVINIEEEVKIETAPLLDSNFNLAQLKEEKWQLLHLQVNDLEFIIQSLIAFKQVLFVGGFGTSKTFTALTLIRLLTDSESQYKVVQFSDSYSYEEFVEGIKPSIDRKYELQSGPLLTLINEAQRNTSRNYFLLIDEMNRGKTVSIFGELLHALDRDYSQVELRHSGTKLQLPNNFFIIGTMNDRDRNLGHIDMAVYRRFAIVNLEEMKIFDNWLQKKHDTEHLSDDVLLLLKLKHHLEASLKLHHEPFPMGIFFTANIKDDKSISFLWRAKVKPFLDRNCLPEMLEKWQEWRTAKETLRLNDTDSTLQSPTKRLRKT